MARYGQKGGDGPNTGKTAVRYFGRFPDGTEFTKRIFNALADPVAYAYRGRIDDKWHLSTVAERHDPRYLNTNHVVCDVVTMGAS